MSRLGLGWSKWNVMIYIRQGSNVSFFAIFYFTQLELLLGLQARACKGGNKGRYVDKQDNDFELN